MSKPNTTNGATAHDRALQSQAGDRAGRQVAVLLAKIRDCRQRQLARAG